MIFSVETHELPGYASIIPPPPPKNLHNHLLFPENNSRHHSHCQVSSPSVYRQVCASPTQQLTISGRTQMGPICDW